MIVALTFAHSFAFVVIVVVLTAGVAVVDYNAKAGITAAAVVPGRSGIAIAAGIEKHKDASFMEWALRRASSLC